MAFLDMNVALGRFSRSTPAFATVETLRAEMTRLGIGEALVYHALASEGDVVKGNNLLLDALKGHDSLHPCWVMAPAYLGDLPAPDPWVAEARERGVKGVRLFPHHSLYGLEPWCVGPLFRALEAARMPVLLDFGPRHWSEDAVPWESLYRLAAQHTELPIVLVGATVGDARRVSALLPVLPNLYIEYHALNPPDMLGQFAEHGLLDRLVFGTGLPSRAGECAVGQTLLGGLSENDLQAVSGETARRLLGTSAQPAVEPLPVASAWADAAVVDVHAHVGSWERTTTPLKSPEAFIRSMDRCGIARMVFSSFSAIHGETPLGNQETAQAVQRFPDRLYGYCVVNPNEPDGSMADVERYLADGTNFVGLKLHCGLHGAQLQDERYKPALVFADAHTLPVLVHGGGQDAWDEICPRFPRAAFIMAHACAWDGRDPAGRALYARARQTRNLYVDLSGSANQRGALRALVGLIGAEKILFGSDFPMFDLAWELARVTLSDLPPEEKRLIAGDNARRLFRRMAD